LELWDYAPAEGRLAAAMATNCANRRPIRPGAFASNLRTFAIAHVPWCPGHRAHRENDVSALSSRDSYENSNGRIAGTALGSGFIASFDPAAEKIFSPVSDHFDRYFGVTPNACANRFV
jgi:hypothetical protein